MNPVTCLTLGLLGIGIIFVCVAVTVHKPDQTNYIPPPENPKLPLLGRKRGQIHLYYASFSAN